MDAIFHYLLLALEITEHGDFFLTVPSETMIESDSGVTVEHLNASWSMEIDKLTLQDISFAIDKVSVRHYLNVHLSKI